MVPYLDGYDCNGMPAASHRAEHTSRPVPMYMVLVWMVLEQPFFVSIGDASFTSGEFPHRGMRIGGAVDVFDKQT